MLCAPPSAGNAHGTCGTPPLHGRSAASGSVGACARPQRVPALEGSDRGCVTTRLRLREGEGGRGGPPSAPPGRGGRGTPPLSAGRRSRRAASPRLAAETTYPPPYSPPERGEGTAPSPSTHRGCATESGRAVAATVCRVFPSPSSSAPNRGSAGGRLPPPPPRKRCRYFLGDHRPPARARLRQLPRRGRPAAGHGGCPSSTAAVRVCRAPARGQHASPHPHPHQAIHAMEAPKPPPPHATPLPPQLAQVPAAAPSAPRVKRAPTSHAPTSHASVTNDSHSRAAARVCPRVPKKKKREGCSQGVRTSQRQHPPPSTPPPHHT